MAIVATAAMVEAEERFREAEAMQVERQPDSPLLYSLRGFRYCDLLLSKSERKAWQRTLDSSFRPQHGSLESCRAVSQRAQKALKWEQGMPGAPILDFAFHHLIIGCAALYEAILQGSTLELRQESMQHAVHGLRRAGQLDYLPRGLLTRAWLRALTGARTGPDSAEADLDEAFEIAERGPMPLFIANIHLYRARLFATNPDQTATETYPWQSPQHDLAEARRLIEKCGYLRRMPELEDAEAVIL